MTKCGYLSIVNADFTLVTLQFSSCTDCIVCYVSKQTPNTRNKEYLLWHLYIFKALCTMYNLKLNLMKINIVVSF